MYIEEKLIQNNIYIYIYIYIYICVCVCVCVCLRTHFVCVYACAHVRACRYLSRGLPLTKVHYYIIAFFDKLYSIRQYLFSKINLSSLSNNLTLMSAISNTHTHTHTYIYIYIYETHSLNEVNIVKRFGRRK